ncbi:MAG: hypothetical protein WCI52_01360 [bacterium]
MPTKAAPTTSTPPDSGDVFARLRQQTDVALGRVQEDRTTTQEVITEINTLEAQMSEASKVTDDTARAAKIRALTETTQQRAAHIQTERQNLARAVAGVEAMMSGMSAEFQKLTQVTPEQTARIEAAKQAIVDAEDAVTTAENTSNIRYLLSGGKVKAVKAAKALLKEAQDRLPIVKSQVDEEVRDRLMNANFEMLFAELSNRSMGTAAILREDVKEAGAKIEIVEARLKTCLEERQIATEALQELRQKVEEQEAILKQEEAHLVDFVSGTADYSTQDSKIKTMRSDIQRLISLRQEATAAFEVKEKAVEYHEASLKGLEQLRGNLRTWITKLELETAEQNILFSVRLTTMKLHADEDAGTRIDGMNREAQIGSLEDIIKIARISGDRAVAMFKGHPETMQRISALKAAQAEDIAKLRKEFADIYADLEAKHGIAFGADSSFTYDGLVSQPTGEPAAA